MKRTHKPKMTKLDYKVIDLYLNGLNIREIKENLCFKGVSISRSRILDVLYKHELRLPVAVALCPYFEGSGYDYDYLEGI